MSRRADIELDIAERIFALEGLGLRSEAAAIYGRTVLVKIRPLLMKQRALLSRSIEIGEDNDEAVYALDVQIGNALEMCRDEMHALWLSRTLTQEEPLG